MGPLRSERKPLPLPTLSSEAGRVGKSKTRVLLVVTRPFLFFCPYTSATAAERLDLDCFFGKGRGRQTLSFLSMLAEAAAMKVVP